MQTTSATSGTAITLTNQEDGHRDLLSCSQSKDFHQSVRQGMAELRPYESALPSEAGQAEVKPVYVCRHVPTRNPSWVTSPIPLELQEDHDFAKSIAIWQATSSKPPTSSLDLPAHHFLHEQCQPKLQEGTAATAEVRAAEAVPQAAAQAREAKRVKEANRRR